MSLALDNNNPGNLKDPTTGIFRKFSNPQEGYTALMNDLQTKVKGASSTGLKPDSTLYEFAQKYAPSTDKNNPARYTTSLANTLKVRPDTKLSELQNRIPEFAHAIATNEDGEFVKKYPLNLSNQPQITPPQITQPQQDESLGGKIQGRLNQISTSLVDSAQGKINPASAVLQTVGGLAGGVNDVVQKGAELIPGVKQVEGLIGRGVQKVASTETGKGLLGKYDKFSKEHPEASSNINAIGNIVSLVPVVKGASLTKGLIGKGIGKAMGRDSLATTIDAISPEMTAKTASQSIAKGGTVKSKLSGMIKPTIDKGTREIAETVNKHIPNFDSLPTMSDKVNATRETVYGMADKLKQDVIKSGQDRVYPFKELNAKMSSVEKPISVKADARLSREFDLAQEAAMKIAKDSGGTISSLFDARKAFDQLVAKEFPNLYLRENAPMRSAVTSMRNVMNDFIETNLPKGTGFKDSLHTQSKLFKAIENMSPKAVSELGTTRTQRFFGRHPFVKGVLNKATDAALIGTVGAGAYGAYNEIRNK